MEEPRETASERSERPEDATMHVVISGFLAYPKLCEQELLLLHSRMPRALFLALPEVNLRLRDQCKAVVANGAVLRAALSEMHLLRSEPVAQDVVDEGARLWVQGLLKQMKREWSCDGAEERKQCFGLVMERLQEHLPLRAMPKARRPRVLIPGRHVDMHAHGRDFSCRIVL